jgi:hypothetical protein
VVEMRGLERFVAAVGGGELLVSRDPQITFVKIRVSFS